MIVRDFNWDSFNRSQGINFLYLNLYKIHSNLSQISFVKDIYKTFVDIKFLSWLGAESHMILSFFGDLFLKIQSWFLGSHQFLLMNMMIH